MPRTLGQALGFLLGFWLALLLSPFRIDASPDERAPFAELESSLLDALNRERAARHLRPLERRPDLDRVARAHSQDMAERRYLAHVTPEGHDPVDRLRRGGVDGFSLAAENVGRTDRPLPNREILHGWIASPDHRGNLFAPAFNATGLGIAKSPDGALVYTQVYVTYPRD